MRYSINKADSGKDAKKVKEVKPDTIVKDGFNENISITNSQEKLQSIMTEKEGKKLKFSAGNETNAEIRYAIIALKDANKLQLEITQTSYIPLFHQKLDIFLILIYPTLKEKIISNSSPSHFLMK